ncbi:MAG: aminotransferase class III-fold pyridoxal phosphate-dependent enzyme [Elusimicrobia bacterium]|nr:aminotransferase class III-fold pyridoxal phosphate-dependent enzyme [Elusimicrobiota bacterium]
MEDRLVENAGEVGRYFLENLAALERAALGRITNVRGRGLFAALDLTDSKTRDEFRARCFDNGIAALSSGPRSVRFRPPLNISGKEIDEALRRLEKSL